MIKNSLSTESLNTDNTPIRELSITEISMEDLNTRLLEVQDLSIGEPSLSHVTIPQTVLSNITPFYKKGIDGQTLYVWIKFADTPTSGMSDISIGKDYLGIAVNKPSQTESLVYSDYEWIKLSSSSGSPIITQRLDTWGDYTLDKGGWVLSAFLGNELNTRVTDLENSAGNIHTHANKTQLDLITQSNIEVLAKLSIVNGNLQIDGNAYATGELSAYGVGDGGGGGGGGSDYERLDTWADYDSTKAGWVLSAFLGNDLNTRVTTLEQSAGGGSVTSVGISVPTGLSVSNSPITSSGVIAIGLQTGYSIPTTAKQGQWDTAFTNNHTHSNKTVLDGITSGLVSNWNTAYTNNHTHSNKAILDGITSTNITNWNTAFANNHTHSNKAVIDQLTQANINVLAKLSIANGNLQIDGNAYATGELSAYGVGSGGGSGGGIIETVYSYSNLGQTFNNVTLTDTFNAYTINQINTRLAAVESGSATTINTTGSGNAITSISKSGTVITANKGLTFSLNNHVHTGVYEPTFSKNTAFNKNFGTDSGTVAQGNDSRITNGQTAYGWGNHATAGYALNSSLSNYVPTSRTITAGNGLTGGGTLADDRTITLGTPSNITTATTNSVTANSHTHNLSLGGTSSQYLNGATTLVTIPTVTAGNGLTGGGQLTADRSITLGTPSILTASTTNAVTSTSHTHAITTTSVGAANTIIQTDATGGTKLNNLKVGGDWKLEQVGTELQLKYNNVVAQRFLLDGSIVGLGEITAYGASTGGEGVALLRTGGTMTGDLVLDANLGMANKSLTLLGNALTYNASNILTEANTANKITMGNGWTIEQTSASLTIRKNGVIKGTFTA